MKKFISILTVLAFTFSLATVSAKEDPKKNTDKKEAKSCCVKEVKEAKAMNCCSDSKMKAANMKCDMSKCSDQAKATGKTETGTEKTEKPSTDKN